MAGFFRSYADQIEEASATQGDVVVPLSEALTHLAGTPAWDALKNDVRLSPGGMSLNEAKDFDSAKADEMQAMSETMSAQMEADRAAMEPRQKLAEGIRDKLMRVGYRPDVAAAYAELVTARYATRAGRAGKVLTGDEANDLHVRQVLPERLAKVEAADQLDLVIQAMKKARATRGDSAKFGPSLLEFVTKRGGIEDPGGDIASMGGGEWHKGRPGRRRLIRARPEGADLLGDRAGNDNTPDALAYAAWEAGYFPNHAERPSVDEFLEAVGDELRGRPVYAEDRSTATDEIREAAQDLYTLLDQQGLDPDKASRKEIRAAIEHYQRQSAEGRSLDQAFNEGVRGRITFTSDGKSIIDLFETRDLSTFIHESGHLFLEELWSDAAAADAPAQLKADRDTLIAWFKANGIKMPKGGEIPTEAHELWARGFERFAMEGRAPSSALRRAFEAFRSWLLTIYKVVENLRSPISDDVRAVMQRLVATDEEIAAAAEEQNIKALFNTAEEAGMTEAEFAAYRKATEESRDEAYDALLYRTMSAIRAQRTKAWKEEEAGVRAKVTQGVDAQPVFRALRLLTAGTEDGQRPKLDRAWLAETYGADIIGQLPRRVPPIHSDKASLHADTIAEMSGFASGDEMVRTLIGLEVQSRELKANGEKRSVRQLQIDQATQEAMLAAHGDILNNGSIEDEARALIHSDKQGEVIASEIRALARRAQRRPTPYALAKEWARGKIAASTVATALSGRAIQGYERAARLASQAAEKAMLAGDVDETFRQKQAQMLNNALIAEAKKARDIVEGAAPGSAAWPSATRSRASIRTISTRSTNCSSKSTSGCAASGMSIGRRASRHGRGRRRKPGMTSPFRPPSPPASARPIGAGSPSSR
jgi:hypothetical protein